MALAQDGGRTLSVVIPILNEEGNLRPLYDRLRPVLEKYDKNYELIFIDDGSTDRSQDILKEIAKQDARVCVLIFQTNLGKSMALAAGFREARGDIIFTMDADLQDDPEEIPRFIEAHENGNDLVCGWRKKRHDPLFKIFLSRIFNWATRWVTGVQIHDFNCGFKSYRREVLSQIRLHGDLHRYIPVLAAWRGYRVQEVLVRHHPRHHGYSKYGATRVLHGFLDLLTIVLLTRYDKRPLHFLGGTGLLMTLFGLGINLYLTTLWVIGYRPIGNRPLLLLGILLSIIGIQFVFFGLLAEFLLNLHLRADDHRLDEIITRRVRKENIGEDPTVEPESTPPNPSE
jgi:glycosyltransferase involved in cell wall biosynthesis